MYHGNRHRIAGGGFFSGLAHAIGGVVGGAAKGFLKGGPLGAITGAAGGAVSATRRNTAAATLSAGDNPRGDAARVAAIHHNHAANLARSSPGGSGSGAVLANVPMMQIGAGGGGGGGGGRRRTMRWTNTKALGRAERRIHSAVKHMTRYIKWVHAKKEGHAAPKFHRTKK